MISKTITIHPIATAAGVRGNIFKKRLATTVVYRLFNIIPIWMVRTYEKHSTTYIEYDKTGKRIATWNIKQPVA